MPFSIFYCSFLFFIRRDITRCHFFYTLLFFYHSLFFCNHRCYFCIPPCYLFIIVHAKTYTICYFLENYESIIKTRPLIFYCPLLFVIARYYLLLPICSFYSPGYYPMLFFINRCFFYSLLLFLFTLVIFMIVHTKTDTILYVLDKWTYNTK